MKHKSQKTCKILTDMEHVIPLITPDTICFPQQIITYIRFEVLAAVTKKSTMICEGHHVV
jgi:hypothetical protein